MTVEQKLQIKSDNEKLIKHKGYQCNERLPIVERSSLRSIEEIKGRMSVMNALIDIAFEVPTYSIKEWIEKHNLTAFLTNAEKEIVEKDNDDLREEEINTLHWYIEALWALMWLTNMIDSLDAEEHVGDTMYSLLPHAGDGDTNEKLDCVQSIRNEVEVYTMLDYYFRLHWYCVNERLHGRQAKLNEGQIYQRRKSLEWAYNGVEDWDDVGLNT